MESNITRKPEEDWIEELSAENKMIVEYCRDVFSNPTMTITTGTKTYGKRLYDRRQMIEMFLRGMNASTDNKFSGYVIKKYNLKQKKPYSSLRDLKVGDYIVFPFESWNNVRAAASTLKKQFGAEFVVKKTTPYTQPGDIIAYRNK